jgi:hypothetical protein
VAQPKPELEPDQISLESPENNSLSNLTEQREEWKKLTKYRCAKLVASYPRRLKAVVTAKGAPTKSSVKGLGSEYFPKAMYLWSMS